MGCVAVVFALLAAGVAESPQEAIQRLAMAPDANAVVELLPGELRAEIRRAPPENVARLAAQLQWSGELKRRGVEVEALAGGAELLRFRHKTAPAEAVLSVQRWVSDGVTAFFRMKVCRAQRCSPLGEAWLANEDGRWVFTEVMAGYHHHGWRAFNVEEALAELRKPPYAHNEETAVGALRTINAAVVTYQSTYEKLPMVLAHLAGGDDYEQEASEERAMLVANRFTARPCLVDGYVFEYELRDEGYVVMARPQKFGSSGRRSYFSDETGVIRYTDEDRKATEQDQALE